MKRKLLALLLCGALLLTCSPAFAEGDGEPGGTDWAQTACTKTTGCTLDESHEGECMVNNTDTTGTEGNGTGNTDPNTADPNIADPDGTDPDTADPDGTDPDTTDPDTTEPDGATPSEAVQALQAQIDALPDAAALESMTEEEQGAVFAELDALYIAIGALAPEEAAQLETARLDAAAEWFTSQIATYGEPVYVAQIGDTQYETLAKAIAEAGKDGVGTEIKLMKDIDSEIVPIEVKNKGSAEEPIIIDFNAYTIRGSVSSTTSGVLKLNNSYVTLTDTSPNDKGGITNTYNGRGSVVYAGSGSTLTIDNGISLKNQGTSSSSYVLYSMNAEVTIDNATLSTNGSSYIIYTPDIGNTGHITINGGEFHSGKTSFNTSVLYQYDKNLVTINGGTFSNWIHFNNHLVGENKTVCISSNAGSTKAEVKKDAPGSYVAWAEDKDISGFKVYLVEGDLYNLQWMEFYCTDVFHVVNDVPYTFPAGEAYGNSSGISKALTLELNQGVTLTGNVPLKLASVTIKGDGKVGEGVFKAFDGSYTMTKNGENGVYESDIADVALAVTLPDGTVKKYNSSQVNTAIRNLTAGTAVLYQSISTSEKLDGSNMNLTLDLNGHTYTYTGNGDAITLRSPDSYLKITDASGNGGTVTVKSGANTIIATTGLGAHVVIDKGVTVRGTVFLAKKDQVLDIYGTIDATGITDKEGYKCMAIANNGATTENSTINLHDGTVVKSDSHAIYHPGIGTLNVHGGAEVTGGNVGIEMRKGTLNVYEGATITGGRGTPSSTANGSGSTTSNAAIAVAQHGGSTDPVKVNVYGGKISGRAAVYESNPQGNDPASTSQITLNLTGGAYKGQVSSETQTGFITGGQFSTDVKEYIADGYDQLVTQNGTSTPFWVDQYANDALAANAMGTNVYKVTYTLDSGDKVDVYYKSVDEANAAAEEFNENQTSGANAVVTETPIRPTTSGGSGGTTVSRPVILSPTQPQTALTAENSMVTLRVQASGATGYQWYVNRGDGRGWVAILGANGASLTIWPSLADNGNQYYCLASGGGGSTASPVFTLSVLSSMRPPKTGGAPGFLPLALLLLGAAGYVCSRRLCRR